MARRANRGAKAETKLARVRLASGLTQRDVYEATGMSRSVYWRLERGSIDNPPLRHLTNCALVLGVPVEELIEEEWRTTWLQLSPDGPKVQPDPKEVKRLSDERSADPRIG